jgi:hypothetical protein
LTLVLAASFEWYRRKHGTFVRFSLRTASIGVVACAVCFAWLHYRVAHWNRQLPAIVRLERAGARIQYDSILPAWIRELVNDKIGRPFDRVISIDLSYSDASDTDLRELESLPSVRSLDLAATRISDSALRHVGRLPHLNWLSLDNTAITDQGLDHLQNLRGLECLDLDETRIEGPGLKWLAGMEKLEIISLRNGPLRDDGLQNLIGLPQLWVVYTLGSKVTRRGADEFKARSQKHVCVDYGVLPYSKNAGVNSPDFPDADPFVSP